MVQRLPAHSQNCYNLFLNYGLSLPQKRGILIMQIDYLSDILYRLLDSGTWSVFADEHEAIRSLGIPSNLNWVPADENAWTYAAANDDWNFDSSTDPVK